MTHIFITALGTTVVLILYCLPALLATFVRHRLVGTIWLINICLGWTVVGWAGALWRGWLPATGSTNSVAGLVSSAGRGSLVAHGNLRGVGVVAGMLAGLGIAFSFAPPLSHFQADKTARGVVAGASMPAQTTSKWSYNETRDPDVHVTDQFADLDSDNKLSFDFPYEGGATKLTLRRETDQTQRTRVQVYLDVDGRFNCAWKTGDTISVTFDTDPPVNYTCTITVDDQSGVLFIDNPDDAAAFVNRLKTARHVTIEAPFYPDTRRRIEFSTAGLDMNRLLSGQ